jgi:hypothetical protein
VHIEPIFGRAARAMNSARGLVDKWTWMSTSPAAMRKSNPLVEVLLIVELRVTVGTVGWQEMTIVAAG